MQVVREKKKVDRSHQHRGRGEGESSRPTKGPELKIWGGPAWCQVGGGR